MVGECSVTTNVSVAIRHGPGEISLGISIGADGSHNPAPRFGLRVAGTNCTDEPEFRIPFRNGGWF